MNKPIVSALMFAAALAACKPEPQGPPRVGEGDEAIACALGGAAKFASSCRVERSSAGGTLVLTVRHPDGAFRRFEVLKDGRGLAVADGAEPASLSMIGKQLEVAVGLDRYRFPATQRGDVRSP